MGKDIRPLQNLEFIYYLKRIFTHKPVDRNPVSFNICIVELNKETDILNELLRIFKFV